jgi:hypothetical protein
LLVGEVSGRGVLPHLQGAKQKLKVTLLGKELCVFSCEVFCGGEFS